MLRRLSGCLLVFDLTESYSLEECKMFMQMIARFNDDEFVCLLVGNKKDIEERRAVSADDV